MIRPRFWTATLKASPITGLVPNVHFCSECGALITTEWREMHREWHERLEGGS